MNKRRNPLWGLGILCAMLGVFLSVVPGMKFSALLLYCTAAFCYVTALLSRLAETRRWARVCRNVLLGLFCAGLALFLTLEGVVFSGAKGDAEDAPVGCVIVLGAGVNGTEPSLILWSRLNATLDYIADKPDIPIIVSGCQGIGEDISEAECMYRWLTAHGVDGSRVWKEEQATSTRTNFVYSYALMAERGLDPDTDFAFVTSDFHLRRARLLADTPNARGVAAALPNGVYYTTLTVNYYVREAFALANEFLLRMDLDV